MQMTTEQVNDILDKYRENTARAAIIEAEITRLQELFEAMEKTVIEDSVMTTSVLTGMPRANRISDPTGRIAIDAASGTMTPEMKTIRQEIRTLTRERLDLLTSIGKVDALLKALNEKQCFVVRRKAMDQMTWREIVYAYEKLFDIHYSIPGMKKIYKSSMLKLYHVAGCPT